MANIQIQTEAKHENSDLLKEMKEEYSMFEINFKMLDTGLTLKAHSHIVFPKCKSLSSLEKDEEGNFVIDCGIERQYFESFLKLLYGCEISISFLELVDISNFASDMKYANSEKITTAVINNVDKISYSDENDQMDLLFALLDNTKYKREDILKKCKLSQLKRLKVTCDVYLLKLIIDEILERYTRDTKSIKAHQEKLLNDNIGKYETLIHKLRAELVTAKQTPLTNISSNLSDNADPFKPYPATADPFKTFFTKS